MEPDELTAEEELRQLEGFGVYDVGADTILTDDDVAFLEEFEATIAKGGYPEPEGP